MLELLAERGALHEVVAYFCRYLEMATLIPHMKTQQTHLVGLSVL